MAQVKKAKKKKATPTTDWGLAKRIVETLELSHAEIISPGSVNAFRKYLTEMSKATNREYVTRTKDDGLHVTRIK